MAFELRIEDHSKEVLDAMIEQVQLGLDSIGEKAEELAKGDCPVNTGRLRNSITYATATGQGSPNNKDGEDAKPEDYKTKATPEEKALYLGTNVEYAQVQELTDMDHKTGKAHFLRDAITQHKDEYKKIMKAALDT